MIICGKNVAGKLTKPCLEHNIAGETASWVLLFPGSSLLACFFGLFNHKIVTLLLVASCYSSDVEGLILVQHAIIEEPILLAIPRTVAELLHSKSARRR